MFIIEIAKIKIKINNKYSFLEKYCKDYIVDSSSFDFEVEVSYEEIDLEASVSPKFFKRWHLESICAYRKISLKLPKYDAFLIHAASVRYNSHAYLILAKSGTGKSTHANNLKLLLGDKLGFINGDKPIIRLIDKIPYAFGSPWNGKENLGSNIYSPVKAMIFLERSNSDSVEEIDKKNLTQKIIHQILLPTDEENLSKTFVLLNATLDKTKQYLLKCTKEPTSALVTYNQIMKE